MNQDQLKTIIEREIKPKGFLWCSKLAIDLLDYEYPVHTPEEIAEALKDFTPYEWVENELGQIGFDCNKQAIHMAGHLIGKGKVVGQARSRTHYFLVFTDGQRLFIIEPKTKWIVSYKDCDPLGLGTYDLSRGKWLNY